MFIQPFILEIETDRRKFYFIGTTADAFSLEFCGGPHVSNTSEIHAGGKKFKIKKEEAVASGVRRIKAVVE